MADPLTPEARVRAEALQNTILAWAMTSPHSEPSAYERYRNRAIEQVAAVLADTTTAPAGTCGECAHWKRHGVCQNAVSIAYEHDTRSNDGCRLGFTPRTETR